LRAAAGDADHIDASEHRGVALHGTHARQAMPQRFLGLALRPPRGRPNLDGVGCVPALTPEPPAGGAQVRTGKTTLPTGKREYL